MNPDMHTLKPGEYENCEGLTIILRANTGPEADVAPWIYKHPVHGGEIPIQADGRLFVGFGNRPVNHCYNVSIPPQYVSGAELAEVIERVAKKDEAAHGASRTSSLLLEAAERLKPKAPAATVSRFWMIANIEGAYDYLGRRLTPQHAPRFMHPTRGAAEVELLRLAKENSSGKFVLLEAVATADGVVTETVVYQINPTTP